ncbi:MAG: hypothetical protein ACRCXA_04670 [Peptostreptococcaceae bacterium]
MLHKNKGSVLIITLIIFSIVSLICMTCISLIYSSIKISNLELKNLELKESSLSALEIVYANMKEEVNNIIDNSNNQDEFINCFRNDNFKSFIAKSTDISKSKLRNAEIEMVNKTNFGEVKKLEFTIKATSRENAYKKEIKIKVQIKNPWIEVNKNVEIDKLTEMDLLESEDVYSDVESESIKDEFKKQKLINIYDYEEL